MIVLATVLSIVPAYSHSWYPSHCCNGDVQNGDCHPIPCDQLTELQGGRYKWKQYEFRKERVYSSQDNQCHVCVGNGLPNGGVLDTPYCVFIQPSS